MVGLQLGTQQPLFLLVVAGENMYAASSSGALLEVLLLFFHLCDQELGGMLGGRSMQHLQLGRVLKRARPRSFNLLVSNATRLIGRYF